MDTQFYDVFVTEGENPTFAYRTGLTTYTEGLRDGIFTALGWNGAGYMALAQDGCDPTILNPADYIAPQAFELELDGQSLMSHWAYEGCERIEGKDNHLQNHTAPYRPSRHSQGLHPAGRRLRVFALAGDYQPRAVASRAGQARRPQRRAGDDAALEKPCEGPERRQPLPARLL